MAVQIVVPREDQWLEVARVDAQGFGEILDEEEIGRRGATVDLDRFRVAMDGSDMVGVAGSFALDMTLPGGASVPHGGVTWVSVAATHRRQGILRRLLDAVHADIDERGEPTAGLFASEGGIYERFGYGMATVVRVTEIVRAEARLRPEFVPAQGSVRYVNGDEARAHVERIWPRVRRLRAGEVAREQRWHDMVFESRTRPQGPLTPAFYLAHADGYAVYRIASKWDDGHPAHRLELGEFAAVTDDAYVALWHALLGVDLVGVLRSRQLTMDERLPYLLTDQRALRTTNLNDGVWINVRDVATAFSSRTYGTADRLIVEVGDERWAIAGDGKGGECKPARGKADLVTDHATLGALLLGGISPTHLAAGRRLTARSAGVLARAEAFFRTTPLPHCQTHY